MSKLADDIKSSLDIVDIISQYTSLRRTSKGWSGLCPFHDEKTPSFHVYSDTQSYYCFSCHEAGDIFTFVMKKNGLTFPEAVELLAPQAGVDPSKYSQAPSNSQHKRSLYDVMNLACDYFRDCYKRLPAGKAYFSQRGFREIDADAFGIGYAPDSWDGLKNFLLKKGIHEREMLDAGLVIQSERGGYDRFRGRLIFTVKNLSGKIIAFGGRAIADSPAKYINSPESEIYKKRDNLYLIDKAASSIREKGFSILCEGYLDALRLHVCGFSQAVASLGTSLTAQQAALLKRFADRCYICYDTDAAGQAASLRGMYILAENGLDVRVITLPQGKDPDEFLSSNSPSQFQSAIDNSLSLIEYHIALLRPSLSDPLKRKQAASELWEGVKRIGADEALRYLASLASAFELPTAEVRSRLLSSRLPTQSGAAVNSVSTQKDIDNGLEYALCALLSEHRECRLSVEPEELAALLTDGEARLVAEAMIEGEPEELIDLWRAIGDVSKVSIVMKGEIFLATLGGTWREKWDKVHSGLEALRIRRRLGEIEAKLFVNSATEGESLEFMELRQKLAGLKI